MYLLIITDISHKIMNCLAKLNKNDYIGLIKASDLLLYSGTLKVDLLLQDMILVLLLLHQKTLCKRSEYRYSIYYNM